MKKFLVAVLFLSLAVSLASAETLLTANPIGQGKWGVLGAVVQDANVMNNSSYGMLTIGGYAGYGITNQLDVLLSLGSANVTGLPAGASASGTSMGLSLKYAVLSEGANIPVSVGVLGGFKSIASKMTGQSDQTDSQMILGVGVSKVMAPFVPYGGIAYRSDTVSGTALSTQLDLTVGSAIAWSTQGAVYAEYTMQSITPNGGSSYNSGQLALGVGYKI
jgi:hypothetical protein